MSEQTFDGSPPARDQDPLHEALDTFTIEVALLFFRMRLAATEYLGRGVHSSGHRSVLKSLDASGPQTVPHMARVRSVSRQHVQKLVDGLKADGLVAAIPNPAHRRSSLIALTRRGEGYLEEVGRRESDLWDYLGRGLTADEVAAATTLVRTLKERFESAEWVDLARSG